MLLVFVVAAGLAVPGVSTWPRAATHAPALAARESARRPAAPVAAPPIVPTPSPSPGDVTPPVTTASGMGVRWRNDAATVKLAATDAGSGVASHHLPRRRRSLAGSATRSGCGRRRTTPTTASTASSFYSVDNALNAGDDRGG